MKPLKNANMGDFVSLTATFSEFSRLPLVQTRRSPRGSPITIRVLNILIPRQPVHPFPLTTTIIGYAIDIKQCVFIIPCLSM